MNLNLIDRLRPIAEPGRKRRRAVPPWAGIIGCVLVAVFVFLTLFADLVTPYSPLELTGRPLAPPSPEHWLGTDDIGRDVWSYVVHGSAVSMQVGISVAIITFGLGILVGSVAGYLGGAVDGFLLKVAEFFQVIPGFVLALVIVAIMGQNTLLVILALSLTMWPRMARIIRAQFLTLKNQEFVEAARSQGFGSMFIVTRDILPNALPPAIVQATLDVGMAILMEAGLSYLGLGDPNRPSWGFLLNRSQQYLEQAPWMSLAPGLAIFLIVLGVNLMGDLLNDWMDGTVGRKR